MIKVVAISFFLAVSGLYAGEDVSMALTMYSGSRAWNVGDLITVIVSEETVASKNATMATNKSASASAQESSFGNPDSGNPLTKFLAFNIPGYNIPSPTSTFDGSGSVTSQETFQTKFTVRVVDTLPNQVLVIRGERMVSQDTEKVTLVLTGLVRLQDVTAQNTVSSSEIADARIRYESDGQISDGSKPGWMWRVFQKINPF